MRAGTLGRIETQGRMERAMGRIIIIFRVALGAMAAAAVVYRVAGF